MANFEEENSSENQDNQEKSEINQINQEIEIENIILDDDEPLDVHITVEDKEETPKTSSLIKDEAEQAIAFARRKQQEQQEFGEKEEISKNIPEKFPTENTKDYKKYVVRIHKENTSFLDKLSQQERNNVFNQSVRTFIENQSSEKRKRFMQESVRHILIILITLVIGVPLIFEVVNFSIKSTLKSYKYMQVNFERLYQQKQLDKF